MGIIIVLFFINNKTQITNQPIFETTATEPLSQTEYQTEARRAVADFELFLKDQTSALTITTRKEKLLELKISKDFQNLHLQLVTIADALLAYNEGQTQEKSHAEELLKEIYSQYPWLNS